MKIVNKIRISVLSAICIIALSSIAYGAALDNVTAVNNVLDGTIMVSGTADSMYQVSFCVTDTSVSSLSYTKEVLEKKTYAIGQTSTVAKDGGIRFDYSLKMPSGLNSGMYRVFVYADNREGTYCDFSYANQKEAMQGYEFLNKETEVREIVNGFEQHGKELYFNDCFYNVLSQIQKEQLAQSFIKNRPVGGYKKLSDMQDMFLGMGFIVTVGSESNVSVMDKFILENGGLCGDLSVYKGCNERIRLSVCEGLKNKICAPKEYFKSIEEECIATSFRLAYVWNDYPELISDFSDYFPLNNQQRDKLSSLKDVTAVYKDMYMKKDAYNTSSDILNKYIELIEHHYNEEKKNQNGSQNNTSSGGGGSAGTKTNNISVAVPDETTPTNERNIFKDINDVLWAKEEIISLYEKGIVSGNSDGYFYPNNNITREEFVKMITLCFDLKKSTEPMFDDVPRDAWYRDYLALAYGEGIVYGIDDNKFGVGGYLTRQDLSVIVYRAMKLKSIEFSDIKMEFSDRENVSEYAREAVGSICGLGIIDGMPDGSFCPNEYATRAQVAKILNKVLRFIK